MRMGRRRLRCVIVALATAVVASGGIRSAAAAPGEPEGLWKASKHFGPEVRGPLTIERRGSGYTADIAGFRVPMQVVQEELTFDLPGRRGTFRGKLERESILGHWYPPPLSALIVGFSYASPVRLAPDGADRWRGIVRPFEDQFTFYLLLSPREDGSWNAVLRNPDRDYGNQIGAQRLVREGSVLMLRGKRRWEKEERELARGTFDAERQALTLTFPDRGGTYEFRRDDDSSGFYPRGRNPGRYVYSTPLARDDGWPTDTLENVGIDRKPVEDFIQSIVETPMSSTDAPQVHAILVARHGKLVLEEYFHGEHRDKLHETRSAAKSMTTTVIGAAMHAGAPLQLSSPVYQVMNGGAFPPDLEPRKRAMTLEHLLTMTSGYFCDDDNPEAPGNEETLLDRNEDPDYYAFTLRVPMASAPGEHAVYCSINPNLALGMLGKATGESPMYAFDRLVGAPLQIAHYGWFLDPLGRAYGGGGMQLLPRDFMKMGQLMLNDGTWGKRRILSREFVRRASAPLQDLQGNKYGFLWWGGEMAHGDRKVYSYNAGGAGGMGVFVIRDLDLVIAVYGANYASGRVAHQLRAAAPKFIVPAVRQAPGTETSRT